MMMNRKTRMIPLALIFLVLALPISGCGTSTLRTPSGLRYDGAAPGQWLRDDGVSMEYGGFTEPPNFVGIDNSNAVRKATSLPSTTMVYDLFAIDSPKDLTIEDAEIELVDGQPTRIRLGKLSAIVSVPIRADVEAIQALAEWVRELNQTQRETIEAIAPGVFGLIDALIAGL